MCNTGWYCTGITWHTKTFIIDEFSAICDATCAACTCAAFQEKCPGPRDGGKDSKGHSKTIKGEAVIEAAQSQAAKIGGEYKGASGEYSMTGSQSGKLTASTEIQLGYDNTHANKGERLDFYGYVAVTVTWAVCDLEFRYAGWSCGTSQETHITDVTITTANGYDIVPCPCGMKHAMNTPDPGTNVPTGAAYATVTVTPGQQITLTNPFPTTTAVVRVVGVPDAKHEMKPNESVTVSNPGQGMLLGTAAGIVGIIVKGGSSGTPQFNELPPTGYHIPGMETTPQNPSLGIPNLNTGVGGCVVGETPINSIPIYGDQTTPWMKVNTQLAPGSELRLKTTLKDGTANVYRPRTLAVITEPAGIERFPQFSLSPNGEVMENMQEIEKMKTVGCVVKFDGLPPASEVKSMSLQTVDPTGNVTSTKEMPVTNAGMVVSMNPQTGLVGSPVQITVDASGFLNTLQMEYRGFDPTQYRLKIDYSASGGVRGPEFAEVGANGKAVFDARRGNMVGSFPIGFTLVPKTASLSAIAIPMGEKSCCSERK